MTESLRVTDYFERLCIVTLSAYSSALIINIYSTLPGRYLLSAVCRATCMWICTLFARGALVTAFPCGRDTFGSANSDCARWDWTGPLAAVMKKA